jgi:hypothetical protein
MREMLNKQKLFRKVKGNHSAFAYTATPTFSPLLIFSAPFLFATNSKDKLYLFYSDYLYLFLLMGFSADTSGQALSSAVA